MKKIKNKIHVGLIHIGKRERSGLQILEKLIQFEIQVSQWDVLTSKNNLTDIESVNVIVVNIGLTSFEYDEILAKLFELDSKVIINEAVLSNNLAGVKRQSWERHLLHKIDPTFSVMPELIDNGKDKLLPLELSNFGIETVWVLAASIGGPESIQKFLSTFVGSEKILFIIIQHMDKEFIPMMADQFDKCSEFNVVLPVSGMKIQPSSCIIYPTEESLIIDELGNIELHAMSKMFAFKPCIDEAVKILVKNIKNLNLAVFSGMSTDGIESAELINNNGNKVITQTESSCVLSTIITGVKEKITIDFDGTPEEMANYINNNLEG